MPDIICANNSKRRQLHYLYCLEVKESGQWKAETHLFNPDTISDPDPDADDDNTESTDDNEIPDVDNMRITEIQYLDDLELTLRAFTAQVEEQE